MAKVLIIFSFLLFLFGCASKKEKVDSKTQTIDAQKEMDLPKWVYSAQQFCQGKFLICASAEGGDFNSSDENAKTSLASIFETKIKSKFEMEQHHYSEQESEKYIEEVKEQVNQSVDTVLKGAFIKDRFHKDDLYFSLAALDKIKATKILRREMGQLDDQLKFLYQQGHKTSILKMLMLYDQRQMLNQKYTILTNSEIPTDFSFAKINSLKYVNPNEHNKIHLKAVNSVPRTTMKWIESLFTQMGYKVSEESAVNYWVNIKYFAKEEYLKVRGFKKFKFTLIAESKNNSAETLGVSQVEVISTGRNQQDAFLRIKEKLQELFKNNIEKLNLK